MAKAKPASALSRQESETLQSLIAQHRAESKAEKAAKDAKEILKGQISPYLTRLANRRFDTKMDDGTPVYAVLSPRKRESVNPGKLLDLGVKPSIIRQATDVTPYDQLDVRAIKGKGAAAGEGEGEDV